MSYAIVTAKVDPQTKKEAQEIAEKLGMPLSLVIKGFLREFIRTRTVIFRDRDEIPNERLKKIFRQADKDLKAGKASPIFTNIEDDLKWLEKQGI